MTKDNNILSNPISRRRLMTATGATLIGGAVACTTSRPEPPPSTDVRAKLPTAWLQKAEARGRDTAIAGGPMGAQHRISSFINTEGGFRNAELGGKKGFEVQIKPTGYRGIPLWSVKSIELTVDGKPVNSKEMAFTLENRRYQVADLQNQIGTQWWILEWATIFVPRAEDLIPGEHEVGARMTYTSLYGTEIKNTVLEAKERLILESSEI